MLWATGFGPTTPGSTSPSVTATASIRHDGGVVTEAPGLYVLGLPVLRTRASTYIHGAAADTTALADHLHTFLSGRTAPSGFR